MGAMLTTVDNPHDPRTNYRGWYAWDVEHGYNTCAYLGRVTVLSEHLPQEIQDAQIEAAMDEIIEIHAGGLYIKLPVSDAA